MNFLVNIKRHSEVTEDKINSIRCSIDAGYNNTLRDLVLYLEQNPSPSFSPHEFCDLVNLVGFLGES
jgi:hypothetical protein